jgi:hypothetical protein
VPAWTCTDGAWLPHRQRFRRFPRTRFPRFPRTKTPKYCPNRRNSRPAWEEAPHTLPRTPFLALGRGCFKTVAGGGKPETETCLVPRNGSGEPARAWSPAWDMVAADPCNGFHITFPDGIPSAVRPLRACQLTNSVPLSRYPYGQTRALPLSSNTCLARTSSPSTILRHRPPVTRFKIR